MSSASVHRRPLQKLARPVTMLPMENGHRDRVFVAQVSSPEPRRLYLSHTGIERSSFGSFENLGWELVVTKILPSGGEDSFRDHWEETFLEILRSARNYSDQPLQWFWLSSGQALDVPALQPEFDASARFLSALTVWARPDGAQRLCFNAYDDGTCRFTLEERIEDRELVAWVAVDWSDQHPHLPSALAAARSQFSWSDWR